MLGSTYFSQNYASIICQGLLSVFQYIYNLQINGLFWSLLEMWGRVGNELGRVS